MFANKLFWMLYFLDNMLQVLYAQVPETTEEPQWSKYRSSVDFRKVLYDEDTRTLYAGGVNALFKFDPEDITGTPIVLQWEPAHGERETCIAFNEDENLCQNNIGVLISVNETHLYACGTMAFRPTCIYIKKESFAQSGEEERGRWKSPYDPYVSTVSVIANETLFTATLASMQGHGGIISRTLNGITLRTEESDKYWLNDPVFLDGYHVKNNNPVNDKVMIFFREKAEEFQPFMYGMSDDPQQRTVVSRVATVCVNDHGGTAWVLRRKFATYVKMSIECHTAPDSQGAVFRYTHLESTFVLENDEDPTNPTIFGIFTLPNGAIAGSAVCAFNMNEVQRSLATNQYWNRQQLQHGPRSEYTGKKEWEPGNCVDETQDLDHSRLSFGKKHPVKFGIIYPSFPRPHYQESSIRYKHIVVDKVTSEKSSFGRAVTVMYMVTANGLLKRVVHEASNPPQSWSLPDIQINLQDDVEERISNMILGNKQIFVITNRTVTQIPLAACSLYKSCGQCQRSYDPYCVLSNPEVCEPVNNKSPSEIVDLLRQDIICPEEPVSKTPELQLIEQLRSNLTELRSQKDDSMKTLTHLMEEQSEKVETCQQTITKQNITIKNLTDLFKEATQKMEDEKLSFESTSDQLTVCRRQRNYIFRKAAQLAAEVERRLTREEYDKEVEKLHQSSALTTRLLHLRREQLYNLTLKTNACYNDLQTAKRQIIVRNATCKAEKRKAIIALSKEMKTMHQKLSSMHESSIEKDKKQNSTLHEASLKVEKCDEQRKSLTSEIDYLRKAIKNKTLQVEDLNSESLKQEQLIRQLTWLHKRNGERGQQKCTNNGWFLSNATGNLFLLGKRRASFQQAIKMCSLLNARLAVFSDPDELRYITNVIRAFEPTRHFWIGLVKNANTSFNWIDGSSLENGEEKFPGSQRARILRRAKYCTEIRSNQRWSLIPCGRSRRPICQKLSEEPKTLRTPTSAILEAPKYRKSG